MSFYPNDQNEADQQSHNRSTPSYIVRPDQDQNIMSNQINQQFINNGSRYPTFSLNTSMAAQLLQQSSYYVISEPWELQQLSKAILDAAKQSPTPILGLDCEGLAKSRSMQLIQVYFANKSFLIDLRAVNPCLHGFKEVLESNQVMKIFHDFCEDASALICQFNLICNFVFDT